MSVEVHIPRAVEWSLTLIQTHDRWERQSGNGGRDTDDETRKRLRSAEVLCIFVGRRNNDVVCHLLSGVVRIAYLSALTCNSKLDPMTIIKLGRSGSLNSSWSAGGVSSAATAGSGGGVLREMDCRRAALRERVKDATPPLASAEGKRRPSIVGAWYSSPRLSVSLIRSAFIRRPGARYEKWVVVLGKFPTQIYPICVVGIANLVHADC